MSREDILYSMVRDGFSGCVTFELSDLKINEPCKDLREEGFLIENSKFQGPGLRIDLDP